MNAFRRPFFALHVDHCLYAAGFAGIILAVFVFQRPPFFDERLYLMDVSSLQAYGFGHRYLLELTGSAGPLYSMVHFVFSPLTHLKVPAIRLVNIFFLTGIIYYTSAVLKALGFIRRDYALSILAIPMTYVLAGLALTEIPSMFFFSAGIYYIIAVTNTKNYDFRSLLKLMAGGFMLSVAILGRQPYLVTLMALPILFYEKNSKINVLGSLLLTLFFALAMPFYVFYTWKGLVPPIDAKVYEEIAQQGVTYRLDFFWLCLAYFAMVFWIICPGFFKFPSVKQCFFLLTGLAVLDVINLNYKLLTFLPAKSLMTRLIKSPQLVSEAEIHVGSILCLLGMVFLITLTRRVIKFGYNKQLYFLSIALLALAFSCVKITWGFTSRYAAQAIPLIIPVAGYFFHRDRYFTVRIAAGILAGLLSLFFYFQD